MTFFPQFGRDLLLLPRLSYCGSHPIGTKHFIPLSEFTRLGFSIKCCLFMKGDLFLSRCSVNAVLAILRVIFVAKPIFQQDGTSAALQWNLDQGIRLSSNGSIASERNPTFRTAIRVSCTPTEPWPLYIKLSSKWIDGFRTEPNIQNSVLSFTTLQNLHRWRKFFFMD